MENSIGAMDDIFAKSISCTWTPFIKFAERTAPARKPDTLTLSEPACCLWSRICSEQEQRRGMGHTAAPQGLAPIYGAFMFQSVLLLKPVFFHLITGYNVAIELYYCV